MAIDTKRMFSNMRKKQRIHGFSVVLFSNLGSYTVYGWRWDRALIYLAPFCTDILIVCKRHSEQTESYWFSSPSFSSPNHSRHLNVKAFYLFFLNGSKNNNVGFPSGMSWNCIQYKKPIKKTSVFWTWTASFRTICKETPTCTLKKSSVFYVMLAWKCKAMSGGKMHVRYHVTAAKRFLMFIKPWTSQIIKTYSWAINSRCLIWKKKWNLLLFLQRSRTGQEWVLLDSFTILLFALGNIDLVLF